VPPEDLVAMALRSGDQGLCSSFTEPTLLHEYNLAAFPLAKAAGLYTCYVSNGYMTLNTLRELRDAGLDAIKIDVKGNPSVYRQYCRAARGETVWETAAEARDLGLHVEIVNLLVTGVNDSKEAVFDLIQRHLQAVGPETPLHFTRYYPAHEMHAPATPISGLEQAYDLAKQAGVLYPYLGNVPGHPAENTYCPSCGQLLIKRSGYRLRQILLTTQSACPSCGHCIPCVT
jgi:pyruvate formate lyase activating enzyme